MSFLHTIEMQLLESECETWLVLAVCTLAFIVTYAALRWIDKNDKK